MFAGRLRHVAPSLLLALVACQASAQDCSDLRITPLENPAGYRAREGDRRCEGFYESPVSAEALDLVAATLGDPPPPESNVLWLQVPGSTPDAPVHVQAQAVGHRVYYRMDAQIEAGHRLEWPLTEVAIPSGLDAATIGVLARVREAQEAVVVPVSIGLSDNSPSPDGGKTRLVIRSYVDLDRLVWRLTPVGEDAGDWREVASPRVAAGDIRTVEAEPVGEAVLTLSGRRAGTGNWIERRFRIRLPDQ